MKTGTVMAIFGALASVFNRQERQHGINVDPQVGRKGKSKGGGKGRGLILKAGRPLPFGTPVGNDPSILKDNPFAWIDNWHSKNRASHRGPRGTGHARRKCWR